jgi:hypothetical protein
MHNPTQHETNLAATFTLSWNRLECLEEQKACTAQRLLCAAGYCAANTPIPWEVFYHLEGAEDGQAQAAVGGLDGLSGSGGVDPPVAEFARLQDEQG